MKTHRYYIKELKSGNYHVIDRLNNIPVYDNERDGKDKPLVFNDEDNAIQFCRGMNEAEEFKNDSLEEPYSSL
jgi:hypothetical protein